MSAMDLEERRDERPEDIEGDAAAGALPTEITSSLQSIAALIADADRRQGEALRELHARLVSLGQEARSARTQVPEEYVPAFERIEDGLTQIASRINRADGERLAARPAPVAAPLPFESAPLAPLFDRYSDALADDAGMSEAGMLAAGMTAEEQAAAPAPLRSAAFPAESLRGSLRPEGARTHAASTGIDTFDIVDSTRPGDADAPWDEAAAEALTRVYESLSGDTRGQRSAREQEATGEAAQGTAPGAAPLAPRRGDAEHARSVAAAGSAPEAPVFDVGRDWLEARFAEIASRVEQSLLELRADGPVVALDSRFDQFENRFGQVLEGMATRSDLDNLREFESHLDELAQHIEQAQLQLLRLDTIEAQLNTVMEKLSDQRLSSILEQSAPSGHDAERIAQAAAEHVAQRLAAIAPAATASNGDAKRLEELRELLDSFIVERRHGEEQTASMLDTMQQAMIRLLDRVDALEFTPHSPAEPVDSDSEHAPPPVPESARLGPAEVVQQHTGARAEPTPAGPPSAPPSAFIPASMLVPAEPATEEERPLSRSGDVTREHLIAEARRAMQVAAARREAEAQAEAAEGSVTGNAGGRKVRSPSGEAASGGISKSSRRIMVGACALLLLSSAVLLLMPRKPATNLPQAKSSQTEPAARQADSAAETAPRPKSAEAKAPAGQDGPPDSALAGQPPGGGETPARADAPRTAGPQAIPPGFLPRSIPETGVDELSHPGQASRATLQEANGGVAAFPGITLHRNSDMSPREVSHLKERQRMAELSAQLGAAQAAAPAAYRAVPVALSAAEPSPAEQPADTGAVHAGERKASGELPPFGIGPNSLRQAAAKGDPSAEFEVAARFAAGKGIQQSFQQALRWYQRSASQGFALAQYRLGTLYERGLGVKSDHARARIWYQRAAEQGHVKAMHNLAVLSAGRGSAAPDYQTATHWFKEAAERGLADSQYNLAVLYESGLGVTKDTQLAYKWFAVAGRSGDREALRRLDSLRGRLSTAEIDSGEKLVSGFNARAADRLVNDAHTAGEAWKSRAQSEASG